MESLRSLAQQVERKRQLAVLEDSVSRQIMDIQDKVSRLKAEWRAEEADVEKLKKMSLTAIFYQIIGKKEEKLEKEQQEALTAAACYQTAQAELDGLWKQREILREERMQLAGCDVRFEEAKKARAEELKNAGSEEGRRILELETALGCIEGQKRELQEAQDAGQLALETTRQVQKELDGRISAIVDGGICRVGVASTILDMSGTNPVILRQGSITKEQLEQVLGISVHVSS